MREVSKLNDIFDLESPELLATEPIKDLFFFLVDQWSLSTKKISV